MNPSEKFQRGSHTPSGMRWGPLSMGAARCFGSKECVPRSHGDGGDGASVCTAGVALLEAEALRRGPDAPSRNDVSEERGERRREGSVSAS